MTDLAETVAVDTTDPYQREAQTFPRLSPEMLVRVSAYGTEEGLPVGAMLYRRGDRSVDFFVVLSGEAETFDEGPDGQRRVFAHHGSGQFAGETNFLNGRESLVSTVTCRETRVLRIARPAFRRLMSADPDIAEVIMRAFILRRVGFIRHGHGGVTLIGPSHCAETLRLQRFMTRNGYPREGAARHGGRRQDGLKALAGRERGREEGRLLRDALVGEAGDTLGQEPDASLVHGRHEVLLHRGRSEALDPNLARPVQHDLDDVRAS